MLDRDGRRIGASTRSCRLLLVELVRWSAGCSSKRSASSASVSFSCSISASVLAAVIWTRKPTSSWAPAGRPPASRRSRVEQEAADGVDVLVVGQRDLDDREARSGWACARRAGRRHRGTRRSSATGRRGCARRGRSLTSKPASTVASDATGDGPEYRYGGAAVFSISLSRRRAGDERRQRRVRLREPADQHDVVVGLAEVADDAVAAAAVAATARRAAARRSRRTRGRRRRRAGPRSSRATRANSSRSGALPVMLLTPSMQIRRARACRP